MRHLLAAAIFILFTSQACSSGYETYKKTDGVTFAYKWAEAKNEAGEKVPALLISVQNENEHAVNYKMSVDFYFEGMLRESGELENCVPAGKTRKGKLNGVYLVSEKFTSSQINSTDFKLELNDIEVTVADMCTED